MIKSISDVVVREFEVQQKELHLRHVDRPLVKISDSPDPHPQHL